MPEYELPQLTEEQRLYREKEHYIEVRQMHRTGEMRAQIQIELLSDRIEALRHPLETQLDLPPLRQTFKERLIEGLDHILSRITP